MSRDLKKLRQRQFRQNLKAKTEYLSTYHKAVAVAVYILSGHCARTAGEYCRMQRGGLAHLMHWRESIENRYLSWSIEQLVAIEFPESAADVRIVSAAKNWLAEQQTAHWVRDQKFGPGIAPSSAAMIEKFGQLAGPSVSGSVPHVSRTGRRFCQAPRRKLHIRLGKLTVRDDMPDQKIRDKNCNSCL